VGVVDAVEVAGYLLAQEAAGERVVLVAAQVHRPAVGHGNDHAAGVGAVVGADGANGLGAGAHRSSFLEGRFPGNGGRLILAETAGTGKQLASGGMLSRPSGVRRTAGPRKHGPHAGGRRMRENAKISILPLAWEAVGWHT